jgi:Lung seven transmembrane receptor
VGIVELEVESTSALVLLLFVIPLAFTLSGFLLWIMYSLNTTMVQLKARKQRYKLSMFTKLHRILLGTVFVIAIFFVVSSLSFSARLAEGMMVIFFSRCVACLIMICVRLCCEHVESSLVAPRRLAVPTLLRRFCIYRLPLEAVSQQ